MAEDLSDYLREMGVKVHYLHSDVETLERVEILRDLRLGVYDVIVGINLLREGLDLPEVSLVAILDADKEGFLRSEWSLIQTIGRAARHVDGHAVLYADRMTDSMRRAINETQRRRQIQLQYNTDNDIDPQTIRRRVSDILLSLGGDTTAPTPKRERRKRPAHPEMPAEELGRLHPIARGRDARGGEGSSVRVRGPVARRGRRPPQGAEGAPQRRRRLGARPRVAP